MRAKKNLKEIGWQEAGDTGVTETWIRIYGGEINRYDNGESSDTYSHTVQLINTRNYIYMKIRDPCAYSCEDEETVDPQRRQQNDNTEAVISTFSTK